MKFEKSHLLPWSAILVLIASASVSTFAGGNNNNNLAYAAPVPQASNIVVDPSNEWPSYETQGDDNIARAASAIESPIAVKNDGGIAAAAGTLPQEGDRGKWRLRHGGSSPIELSGASYPIWNNNHGEEPGRGWPSRLSPIELTGVTYPVRNKNGGRTTIDPGNHLELTKRRYASNIVRYIKNGGQSADPTIPTTDPANPLPGLTKRRYASNIVRYIKGNGHSADPTAGTPSITNPEEQPEDFGLENYPKVCEHVEPEPECESEPEEESDCHENHHSWTD
ncbi:hypothetical protein BGW39_001478 [Mortierella sp. 14UC]|nr:hypothetical protein BGW39_001478 [Mortierella sp. 14UC]